MQMGTKNSSMLMEDRRIYIICHSMEAIRPNLATVTVNRAAAAAEAKANQGTNNYDNSQLS